MNTVHWYVPGVVHTSSPSLPQAKNLSRNFEHISGTSKRDALALAYSTITDLYNQRSHENLKNYLNIHAHRLVNEKLGIAGFKNYHRLSHNERVDLALAKSLLNISTVTHLQQLEQETDGRKLLSIFINFLREIQSAPLYFEPLISLVRSDARIFPEDSEMQKINRNIVRRI